MEITDEDVAVAKDRVIAVLINETLGALAEAAMLRRELAERTPDPSENGKVSI